VVNPVARPLITFYYRYVRQQMAVFHTGDRGDGTGDGALEVAVEDLGGTTMVVLGNVRGRTREPKGGADEDADVWHRYNVVWISKPPKTVDVALSQGAIRAVDREGGGSSNAYVCKVNLVNETLGGAVTLSNNAVFANPTKGADLNDEAMARLGQIFSRYGYANEEVLAVSKVAGYAVRWVYAHYCFGDAVRQLGHGRMAVSDWAHVLK
jgi:hypothetical protein